MPSKRHKKAKIKWKKKSVGERKLYHALRRIRKGKR